MSRHFSLVALVAALSLALALSTPRLRGSVSHVATALPRPGLSGLRRPTPTPVVNDLGETFDGSALDKVAAVQLPGAVENASGALENLDAVSTNLQTTLETINDTLDGASTTMPIALETIGALEQVSAGMPGAMDNINTALQGASTIAAGAGALQSASSTNASVATGADPSTSTPVNGSTALPVADEVLQQQEQLKQGARQFAEVAFLLADYGPALMLALQGTEANSSAAVAGQTVQDLSKIMQAIQDVAVATEIVSTTTPAPGLPTKVDNFVQTANAVSGLLGQFSSVLGGGGAAGAPTALTIQDLREMYTKMSEEASKTEGLLGGNNENSEAGNNAPSESLNEDLFGQLEESAVEETTSTSTTPPLVVPPTDSSSLHYLPTLEMFMRDGVLAPGGVSLDVMRHPQNLGGWLMTLNPTGSLQGLLQVQKTPAFIPGALDTIGVDEAYFRLDVDECHAADLYCPMFHLHDALALNENAHAAKITMQAPNGLDYLVGGERVITTQQFSRADLLQSPTPSQTSAPWSEAPDASSMISVRPMSDAGGWYVIEVDPSIPLLSASSVAASSLGSKRIIPRLEIRDSDGQLVAGPMQIFCPYTTINLSCSTQWRNAGAGGRRLAADQTQSGASSNLRGTRARRLQTPIDGGLSFTAELVTDGGDTVVDASGNPIVASGTAPAPAAGLPPLAVIATTTTPAPTTTTTATTTTTTTTTTTSTTPIPTTTTTTSTTVAALTTKEGESDLLDLLLPPVVEVSETESSSTTSTTTESSSSTIPPTEPSAENKAGSSAAVDESGLPEWAWGVIGAAIVLVCLVVLVVIGLFIYMLYGKYGKSDDGAVASGEADESKGCAVGDVATHEFWTGDARSQVGEGSTVHWSGEGSSDKRIEAPAPSVTVVQPTHARALVSGSRRYDQDPVSTPTVTFSRADVRRFAPTAHARVVQIDEYSDEEEEQVQRPTYHYGNDAAYEYSDYTEEEGSVDGDDDREDFDEDEYTPRVTRSADDSVNQVDDDTVVIVDGSVEPQAGKPSLETRWKRFEEAYPPQILRPTRSKPSAAAWRESDEFYAQRSAALSLSQ